ncbi:hypothetical protein SAMN05421690_101242 [Nitrosomonas sp. Nm51]|uniref:DUF4139 domain-containing protein n=1 Tax=Nitrosomonas sp. Nm51 TaxID=133720 RepID=UPI0008C3E1B4|nr:DUF4139 domain-containing protein [Nitrosomonas sp. Nm51]SER20174.1 hypothetical protein SAMN05421690_101242 [Nitrosomonas sp. Nm51]
MNKTLARRLTIYIITLAGLIIAAAISLQAAFAATEITTTRGDQAEIALSLYQHDLALVKDTRHITLQHGLNRLVWQEISARIKPQTAWLSHSERPELLQTVAQHFNLNLLTPQQLLESHTGKPVTVIRLNPATGDEHKETATVLTTNGGIILKFSDRIETGMPGRLAFSEIPDGLRDKPAMTAVLDSQITRHNKPQPLQLTYLSHGLSWQADYILELDQQDRQASLTGMATLTNQSGIDFHHARIQLIAGDINQVQPASRPVAKQFSRELESMSAAAADIDNTAHFELHRYPLPVKTTLRDNQSQQVAFMSARAIPIEKQFILTGQNHYYSGHYRHAEQKQAVDTFIKFRNNGGELGVPLPAGIIRAYKRDQHNDLHFVGEDTLSHTPGNVMVRLQLGQAFDITAEKKQIDFKKIPSPDPNTRQFETAHRITLSNAKKEAVTVIVREPVPGDWRMLSESHPHQKITANTAEWRIELPAERDTVLAFRVLTAL